VYPHYKSICFRLVFCTLLYTGLSINNNRHFDLKSKVTERYCAVHLNILFYIQIYEVSLNEHVWINENILCFDLFSTWNLTRKHIQNGCCFWRFWEISQIIMHISTNEDKDGGYEMLSRIEETSGHTTTKL